MPERFSSLTRFLLLLALYMGAVTVAFFALSSYYFNDINITANYSALTDALNEEAELLHSYRTGRLSSADLQQAVNPALNADSAFYMLLDEEKHVLAYTESAAPYFAGSTLPGLLDALDRDESAAVRRQGDGETAILAGQKVPGGYVLAGRPTRSISGTVMSFRTRMLMSMGAVVILIVLVGSLSAQRVSRPARIITEMAGRLTEGELVTLPENLPGKDVQEIAGALNYMSRTVTRAIGYLKY